MEYGEDLLEETPEEGEVRRSSSLSRWRIRRWGAVVMVGIVGTSLSLVIWWWLQRGEQVHEEARFALEVDELVEVLEGRLEAKISGLQAVQAVHHGQEIHRGDFARLAYGLDRDFTISPLVWMPRVDEEEREAHESAAAAIWGTGYEIRVLHDGTAEAAPRRPWYLPVYYVEPRPVPAWLRPGLDLLQVEGFREGIERARVQRQPVLYGPLPGSGPGMVYGLFAAIYGEGVQGVVMAVVPVGELLAGLKEQRGLEAVIQVVDVDTLPPTVWTLGPDGGIGGVQSEVRPVDEGGRREVKIAGVQWEIRAIPAEGDGNGRRTPVLFLLGGLGTTLMAVLLLYSAFGRTEWVEKLVEERTRSLQEHREQLRRIAIEMARARQEAVEADRAKSTFLASMSHEIRTPMNGIIGMAELLDKTELSEQQREYLRLLSRSARGLLTLLNDILDFSKIEAGQLELDEREFVPADVVGETLQLLSRRAEEKGLILEHELERGVPTVVVGDPNRLRQVLINLVGNAIKFTDEGGVNVTVSRRSRTDREVELHFQVRDTGMGISKGDRKRIFEGFQQGEASVQRVQGGTGLGLTIAAQLVELMNGEIWVESEAGEGSVFHFTIRCRKARRVPRETLSGCRVVVLDDRPRRRHLLEELLRGWGMDLELVETGEELQRWVREEEPELVIVERSMAEEMGELPELPMIEIVSAAEWSEGLPPKEDASRVYLLSPIKPSDLYEALLAALRYEPSEPVRRPVELEAEGAAISVLLVEDSPVNQKVTDGLLAREGHRVRIASDGLEGVEVFRADPESFDVILMDIQMPWMDGFAATRAIRSLEEEWGSKVPIVALTAHAMKGDRERMLQAGMDDYLAKPIRADDLYEVLRKWTTVREEAEGVRAFDRRKLRERVGDDEELIDELLHSFREEWPRWLSALEEVLPEGEASEARRLAHTIKGSTDLLGAERVTSVARRMEDLCAEGRLEEAAESLEELRGLLEELDRRLEAG